MRTASYWLTDQLEGHTEWGAFSEAYLGEPARRYFEKHAFDTLRAPNCQWTWKEDVQLSSLIINVMRSEMGHKLSQSKVIAEAALRSGISKGAINAAWDAIGEVVKRVTSSDEGNVENPEGEENGSNTGGGNRTHHRGETLWAEVAVLAAFAFCFGQTPERKSAKWGNKIWPNNQTNFG